MKITVQQILQATKGQILHLQKEEFEDFGIDSREIKPGGLFFALKGEQTDGHLFLEDALRHGAMGAVVNEDTPADRFPRTLIRVKDTFQALRDLASYVRSNSTALFVGITGSSGKTSTKEFTAALLSRKYLVFRSEGNLNSITGLPLSLLTLRNEEYAVFEVAMNQPGEIKALSTLLQPDIGLVLNVNPVHLGQFPSVEAIADEKLSLMNGMTGTSTLLYNADDERIVKRVNRFPHRLLSFGKSTGANLRITGINLRGVRGTGAVFCWKEDRIPFETRLCGEGNLYNLTASVCAALVSGLDWKEILDSIKILEPYSQRGVLIRIDGIDVYDDTYNSNPRALEMAADLIGQSSGYQRKIAVLGDMLELGPEEATFHFRAGVEIAKNFDVFITVGELGRHIADGARKSGLKEVYETTSSEEAAELLNRIVLEGDLVLVKGSRGMKMETVVEGLKRARQFEIRN